MTNLFAFVLMLLPFWLVSVSAFPTATLFGRDGSPSPASALGGSDNKTNIDYCGDGGKATFLTEGDPESGPGFYVTNQDTSGENYFLIENSRDTHPWKYLHVPAGARRFVQVCGSWQGRIVRGTPKVNTDGNVHNLGTWVESAVTNGVMSGDISFLQGCDGGAKLVSNDGRGITKGCLVDMLSGAPANALQNKETGTPALKRITGDGFSQAAKDWDLSKCDASQVFILEENRNPIIDSTNGRFEVTFYKGKA
ncbi:hypothetical protein PG993_015114 [Apiospora rasikravindrae]|uniref:Uncharacterized protein n=1 Tax=Apiospora rasikravindrae TaxID=990691 RepID=A0ABR1RR51_9PEZI